MNHHLSLNLAQLRKWNHLTQEEVAERIGVTRQAVAKWENGESVPDILNCDALAGLYNVTLDNLLHHDEDSAGYKIPPKDKHIFGTVRVGERGQIILPKAARDVFHITPGTMLLVLGDEAPERAGLALVKLDAISELLADVFTGPPKRGDL